MKRFFVALFVAVAASFACNTSEGSVVAEAVSMAPAKTETVAFEVSMHCKKCVKKINENIAFEKGVKDLNVDLDTKTVTVTYDTRKTTETKLADALRKLGYEVKVKENK